MSLTDDINNLPTTPQAVMPGHLDHHATIHSALKNHNSLLYSRGAIIWSYAGTTTPWLGNYPGIKVGDYIVRKKDGKEWLVDESMTLTVTRGPVVWVRIPTNEPGYYIRLMREGRQVHAQMNEDFYEGEGTVSIASAPIGYRPNYAHRFLYSEASGDAPSKLLVAFSVSGNIELRSKKADGAVYINVSWFTDDEFPAFD